MSANLVKATCDWQKNVYTILTIGDGSCLFHGYLNAADKTYQESKTYQQKQAIAFRFRVEVMKYLTMPHPEYTTPEITRAMLFQSYFKCSFEDIFKDYDHSDSMISQGIEIKNFLELIKVIDVVQPPMTPLLSRFVINRYQTTYADYKNPKPDLARMLENFRRHVSPDFYDQHLAYWKSSDPNISSNDYSDLEIVAKKSQRGLAMLQKYNADYKEFCMVNNTRNRKILQEHPELVDLRPFLNAHFKTSIYTNLEPNCVFLTASKGQRALKCLYDNIEFRENQTGLIDVMQKLAKLRDYVGFGEALDFLPAIGYNILLLEEVGSKLIVKSDFQEPSNQNYIVLVFKHGNHFETAGVMESDGLQTVFPKTHPFITRSLAADEVDTHDLRLLKLETRKIIPGLLPASPKRS